MSASNGPTGATGKFRYEPTDQEVGVGDGESRRGPANGCSWWTGEAMSKRKRAGLITTVMRLLSHWTFITGLVARVCIGNCLTAFSASAIASRHIKGGSALSKSLSLALSGSLPLCARASVCVTHNVWLTFCAPVLDLWRTGSADPRHLGQCHLPGPGLRLSRACKIQYGRQRETERGVPQHSR